MKRAGFTMIELIFVIVILGILAAVAIPKLAATRTDAEVAARATQIQTIVNEVGAYATAKNTYGTMVEMSVAAAALVNKGAATEASGLLTINDLAATPAACITVSQATADANASLVLASATDAAWTGTSWDNAKTKVVTVRHISNTSGSCTTLQDKMPEGVTAVKGRSAVF